MLTIQPSTLVFEILNFFILLLVLRHFLYRPLLHVMQQREDEIRARVRDADERTREADLERQRLAEQARQALTTQAAQRRDVLASAAQERDALLAQAHAEATRLVDDALQRADQQERAARQTLTAEVGQTAVNLAGQLIVSAAGPAVHQAFLDRLLDDHQSLIPADRELLRRGLAEGRGQVTLELAYPATDDLDARVRRTLADVVAPAPSLTLRTRVKPDLLAGARILAGTVALDLSLRGALEALAQPSATSAPLAAV